MATSVVWPGRLFGRSWLPRVTVGQPVNPRHRRPNDDPDLFQLRLAVARHPTEAANLVKARRQHKLSEPRHEAMMRINRMNRSRRQRGN